MPEFEYTGHPSHVVFGVGSAEGQRFMRVIATEQAQRVMLIVAEADVRLADGPRSALGDRIAATFTDVRPHVPVAVAEAARTAARDCAADLVICVGGGSTTGTAKAVALELDVPIVAVPTTYAGSEVTPVWGLTESGRKTTGVDRRVLPRHVVYDPRLTLGLPLGISIASGLNAIAHCVEAFWAPGRNPITSLMADEGIRALAEGLPALRRDTGDLEARSRCLYGAWLAGTAFATAGSDVHHKVCHVLGGAFDLPHAETHAVVLPYATMLAAPRAPGADARIAAALNLADEPAGEAIMTLERELEAPRSLQEIGLTRGDLPRAIDLVADTLGRLPTPVGHEQAAALVTAAFEGAVEPIPVR